MAVGNRTMEFLITADDSEFQAMTRRVGQRFTELEQSTRTGTAQFMTLGGAVSAFGAGLGALGLASVARDLLAAGMAAQTMTNTMAAATGSITQGAVEMQFVRAEAARLGLDLQNAATDYARLTAAAQGTAIQGEEARRIFSAVAEASVTLGLSADETSGALTAIQQMISKGTVSAEELRGQLGERLPGAFNIAARSMGISTAQLDDMLKKGQVVAGEFLPKFREELLRTFPATASALDSAQANANRFNTALFELKTSIMEQGGLDAFNALASAGSSVVDVLKIGVRWVAESKLAWTTWAKTLGTIMDSGPGFSRWLTAAGRAEISAELDAIQKMDEYSMMKIAERFGNPVRAIGAAQGGAGGGGGSGGRAGNTSKPTSTSRAFFSEAWDRAADELAFEDAQAFVLRLNDLGQGMQIGTGNTVSLLGGPVDLLATQDIDPNLGKRTQLEQETANNILAIQMGLQEERFRLMGDETAALDVQFAYKQQLLDMEYQAKITQAQKLGMDITAIQQEYAWQQVDLEAQKAEALANIWWNNAQTYINFAQQMTTMGVQMLLFEEGQKDQIGKRMLATSIRFIAQGLQQYMFGKAKEHVLNAAGAAGKIQTDAVAATANLGILEAQATAWAAFYSAMSLNPYGGQLFIPAATAMAGVAGGVVPSAMAAVATTGATSIATELALAAAWGLGGIAVGALGEGGASAIEGGTAGSTTPAGYGAGSPASPVVTQPVGATTTGPQMTFHINIGELRGDRQSLQRWLEEDFAPAFRDSVGRNVDFALT